MSGLKMLLSLVVVALGLVSQTARAEHSGTAGGSSRPEAGAVSPQALLSACFVGRPGATGAGIGNVDNSSGLLQVAPGPSATATPGTGPTPTGGAALFSARCATCHANGSAPPLRGKGAAAAARIANGTMPPPPASLSAAEKTALEAFVKTGL